MLNIPCPWCGPRAQTEYHYGGEAGRVRPADDAPLQDWVEHVYLRDNPCGEHLELWQHQAGCGQWLQLRRDTRSHRILAAAALS
ncbi:sarcosine oxidase subunit delta [Stutzerimonas kirkiae]|uniref:Sarcosine oxidase subunit delta n=1 Tax=Stutzerimonas kirkiae TaxID=2211392 RepID=A0A4Q9RAT8_9GAMM|nr:sarcosine oxidase subunit delta [Stutzerimonas kirkiae]TBU97882.1 sarcosine oxidase subunit delta [Stutzerimonas kirkiae]TBV04602.1 sarcosine oxidase subunit delta [Stutzerimonas kirkiae]TBV16060.1 sarcosine oxidase subunit delta [Stutzerimonas kirkiae]